MAQVKLFSLVWKIRHFKGQLLVLESPIAKPFPQFTSFFIAVGLPNTIQHNIPKKRGPIIASLIACLLGTLDSPSAVTRQTWEQPYPLGNWTGYPKCIPADSPLSVQHANAKLYTSPPQFEGDTQPRETGISPSGNVSKATVQHKPGSLEKPHSPGI